MSKDPSFMKSANNNNFNHYNIDNLDDDQRNQLFEKLKNHNSFKIRNEKLNLLHKKETIPINVLKLYECFGERIKNFFPDYKFIEEFNKKNDTHFVYKREDFIEQIKCVLTYYYEKNELFGDYAVNLVFLEILSEECEDPEQLPEKLGRAKSNDHMKHLSKQIGLLQLRKDIYDHLKEQHPDKMETLKRKLDADVFEAVMGKIYKDYNQSIPLLQKWVFDRIWIHKNNSLINQISPKSLLNQFVTQRYGEKKEEGLVKNIGEEKIIYVPSKPGKNRKKSVCVYVDPRIKTKSNNGPTPVFSHVSGEVIWKSSELGFATCTQNDLGDWYENIGDKEYPNIMDPQTGQTKLAKEYLHGSVTNTETKKIEARQGRNFKPAEQTTNKWKINHGCDQNAGWKLDIIKIRDGNGKIHKITVPAPGSYIVGIGNKDSNSKFNYLKTGDSVKKGQVIAQIFLPKNIIFGTGSGPAKIDAETNAANKLLTMWGGKLKYGYKHS